MPASPANQESWAANRIESMRRNISNDRAWWREFWRERSKAPRSPNDISVEREEYVAALESDLGDIDEAMTGTLLKPTAKAILQGEVRQTRALIAKARGIDQVAEVPQNEPLKVPVVGLLVSAKNVSEEVKEQLRIQGVHLE